ncbi:MAG TPA: glycosyltransferase family 2 protein [Chloroflexota bacterium]
MTALTIMAALASAAVTVVAIGLALLAGYLLLLTLAALFGRRALPAAGPATRRFAVLVPAHDEELVIGRLLRSLSAVDYPNFDVCVVADNCTDRTAEIARGFGARVFERFDAVEKAKGFALRWLLSQLTERYDAFVVLDADSVVEPNLLRAMDARLASGSQVIQVYYSVLNASASAVSGLRYAALAALHYVRPLGRSALGLSVGLKGNGMCFSAPVLERFGWDWFTLAEDVEFHLALVRSGVRVDFAWETTVLADMPVTLAQAASQNQRWEGGRLQLLRSHVLGLLLDGLRLRSLLRIDAAVEQLIPPLSVPFLLGFVTLVIALALGAVPAALVAAASLVGQMLYLASGLLLVRAPLKAYLALSSAPVYIAWKVGLYATSLIQSRRAQSWVRTSRIS